MAVPRVRNTELANAWEAEANSGNPLSKGESPRDEYCYNYHLNERVNCDMGLDHVPTRGYLVYSFTTHLGLRQKKEWKKKKQKKCQSCAEHKVQMTVITDYHKKTGAGSYYTGAVKAGELHDLPSHCHRSGDIPKVEG